MVLFEDFAQASDTQQPFLDYLVVCESIKSYNQSKLGIYSEMSLNIWRASNHVSHEAYIPFQQYFYEIPKIYLYLTLWTA